jgi:hypothetical protein
VAAAPIFACVVSGKEVTTPGRLSQVNKAAPRQKIPNPYSDRHIDHVTYFCAADAPYPRGSQPRSSYFAEPPSNRAMRPAQVEDLPHRQMSESGKTK